MRTRRTQSSSNSVSSKHRTVLLHEAVIALNLEADAVALDATAGAGGHGREIIARLGGQGTYIGMDADKTAIDALRATLKGEPRIVLVHGNFRHLEALLSKEGITRLDAALFDLGWRTDQLISGRGFSFQHDEPLLMTYDASLPGDALTARMIVNEWDETSIADILYGWGEEQFAKRIARAIALRRQEKPIERTGDLASIVSRAVPGWYRIRRIHPATKTFQALRIAVNDELGAIKDGLDSALQILSPAGRIAIITFHSIEDRLVKRYFKEKEKEGIGRIITKKPIIADEEELAGNPRARSAKLRVFERN